jgi:uncharacterized protein (DUF1697 family)
MTASEETVYIVLFRGVGGKTQLPTKPLREALATAGFLNVATYINSGNAILSTDRGREEVAEEVAAIAKRQFGFEKDIMLVSRAEWTELINENPFPEAVASPTTLHAFVLDRTPTAAAIAALVAKANERERVVVKGWVLYLHVPDTFAVSKLPPVIDRTLNVISTARNWNTVLKLGKMAEEAAE